ncbi:MAG TPA: hypothetical protein PLX89_23145 [Verrucomicrobiota bacterium]|nr:hypothetical protein [Verrucomicrobiales bacterium]HRI15905.1 hypothetical protein [Verrucomicrobiota bacterium]
MPWAAGAAVLVVGILAASCALLHQETLETTSLLQSISGKGKSSGTNAMVALQGKVMREADQYVAAIAQATDDFRAQVGTIEARDAAQQWKLNEATVAYVNATGENPVVNAVGMVVLASLSRMVVEDYWVGKKFGATALPLLETQRRLETNAWTLVDGVLTPEQKEELRNLILVARERQPDLRYVTVIRLPELTSTLSQVPIEGQSRKPGSLFSLLYLNPLAGLDPTTQAIQQSRILAQRAMYYVERAPMLLGWQVELTTYQLAAQPETQGVLSDVDAVAKSATVFAKTAEGLPQLVSDQRQAAIDQLFAGIAAERTNLLAALNAQEGQLRQLLPPMRETMAAGGDMANSVKGAVTSLDAFVRYVSPPETNKTVSATNAKPFDVLDYGQAASQIGVAAQQLNQLLSAVNQSLPQANILGQQTVAEARALLNHAFRLTLLLIVVAGIVAVLVVWTCRRLLPTQVARGLDTRSV